MPKVKMKPNKDKDKKTKKKVLETSKGNGRRARKRSWKLALPAFKHEDFQSSVISTDESFFFEEKEIFDMYLKVPRFREIIDSGLYTYIDGRIVLKTVNSIGVKDEAVCLKVKGKRLDKYSLKKHIEIVLKPHLTCGNVRGRRYGSPTRKVAIYNYIEPSSINSITALNDSNLHLFLGKDFGGGGKPPTFGDALKKFMDERKITIMQLAECTGLAEKTIQRMRNNEGKQPELESVIAVCIGLHLSSYQSGMMLELAGYVLRHTPLHLAYACCLEFARNSTVMDCNHFLMKLGHKPLTDLYDEDFAKSLELFKAAGVIRRPKNK